jgi:hypothetical protein
MPLGGVRRACRLGVWRSVKRRCLMLAALAYQTRQVKSRFVRGLNDPSMCFRCRPGDATNVAQAGGR